MQIIVSLVISALMVLGSVAYNSEQSKAVGASQSISSLTELTSLSHNDVFPITEVNGLTTKKVKWGTATSTLKVINDALYSPLIGSASLTTLGTITTGTWNADTITVAKGGTGSTSLIAYQLLAGNGTGAVTTFGNGTSGYVLTSNGAGSLPSFQNVGVTTGNNNTWTGTNTFNATTTFSAKTIGISQYYGEGNDGDVTISGSVTLTRDMYYRNLTLSNGSTLNNGGYMIFVSGTLTQNGTGKIANNTAGSASGSTGGTAATGVTIPAGIAGVNGGATTVGGTSGGNAANSVGSDGVTPTGTAGAGGNTVPGGDYGCNTFGSVGSAGVTTTPRILGDYSLMRWMGLYVNGTFVRITGHAGNPSAQGGGKGNFYQSGTCNNGGASGGSGANGGWVVVFARNIVVNPGVTLIESTAGNGGDGTNGANGDSSYNGYGEGGGGAGALGLGGNGGTSIVVYSTKSGAITYNLPAGTNGTAGTEGTGFSATYPGYNGSASTFTGTPIVGSSFEFNI